MKYPALMAGPILALAALAAGQAVPIVSPSQQPLNGQVLVFQNNLWVPTTLNATGTVTSVGVAVPGIFTVSGSPVTGSGTITIGLATQQAGFFLAGPTIPPGGTGVPTFRGISAGDLPQFQNNSGGIVPAAGVTASPPKVLTQTNWAQLDFSYITGGTVTAGTWNGSVIGSAYGGAGAVNGILKANGSGTVSAAVAGTDYQAAGAYITSLTGDVTASGPGAAAASIGAGKVTNGMLAGSIAASKLVGTDIATVGTITAGTWNGSTIGIANGGTGQTTANAAFNALNPMTAQGDMIYGDVGGPIATRLPGNTTTTKKFLTQTGTGAVANAPGWNTIAAGDLPGSFSGFANPTGTVGLSVINGSATTAMRSDASPAISQSISPTWTALHTFGGGINNTSNETGTTPAEQLTGTWTNSSGTGLVLSLSPTVSTTGTGGWTALKVNPTQTSDTGSGAKLLADFQLGGTSVFSVNPSGAASSSGGFTASGGGFSDTIGTNHTGVTIQGNTAKAYFGAGNSYVWWGTNRDTANGNLYNAALGTADVLMNATNGGAFFSIETTNTNGGVPAEHLRVSDAALKLTTIPLAVAESASAAAVASSGTITTAAIGSARVAPTAAVTGVILQSGTVAGQTVTVVNEAAAANTVTFAASATSHVADGTSSVVAGLTAQRYIWDSGTSLWYHCK